MKLLFVQLLLFGAANAFLFENGANGSFCYRIPNVINAGGGTLLAFAEARIKSCSDSGPKALAMRRSLDNGTTWEAVRFVVQDPLSEKDGLNLGASVYDAQRGAVFVHYGVRGHTPPAGTTFVLSSDDHGLTWKSTNITDVVMGAGWSMINAGPGTGVQVAASPSVSRLVVAVWGRRLNSTLRAGGSSGVASLFSDDHGHSWQMSEPLMSDPHAGIGPNECQLADLGNGSLLMNVRNAYASSGKNACHCRLMTISHDSGLTWSPFWRNPMLTGPVCQGSMISVPSAVSTWPLFYSAPTSLEAQGRKDGYVRASLNGGKTWWLRGARLDDPASVGFSYSGLASLGHDGNLHSLAVVFEPSGGILFKKLTVDVSDLVPSAENVVDATGASGVVV